MVKNTKKLTDTFVSKLARKRLNSYKEDTERLCEYIICAMVRAAHATKVDDAEEDLDDALGWAEALTSDLRKTFVSARRLRRKTKTKTE